MNAGNTEFKRCMEERKLIKTRIEKDIIDKEIKEAEVDLRNAEESLNKESYKWCTIQSYYTMFHAAKALLLSKGYREKSHYCLRVALKALFVDTGLLERGYLNEFEETMGARKDADYGLIYSKDSAGESMKNATKFLSEVKTLLKR